MAYDKKTGTITVSSDDPNVLENDVLAHFAHVNKETEKDQKDRTPTNQVKGTHRRALFNDEWRNAQGIDQLSGGIMKWVATILNVALLIVGIWLLVDEYIDSDEMLIIVVLFAAPIVSILAILRTGGSTWLGLYFKRRALEEKKRISALNLP